jgi:hypothetical protein
VTCGGFDPIDIVFFGESVFDGTADETGVFDEGGYHSFGGVFTKHDCLA